MLACTALNIKFYGKNLREKYMRKKAPGVAQQLRKKAREFGLVYWLAFSANLTQGRIIRSRSLS